MQAGRQDLPVPSVLYNNSNHKDSEWAQGPVRPLIIAINAVLHEENTYPRNKKSHFRIRYVLCEIPTAFVQYGGNYEAASHLSKHPLQSDVTQGISSKQGCSWAANPPLPSVTQFCSSFLLSPRGKCSSDPACCWGYSFDGEPPGCCAVLSCCRMLHSSAPTMLCNESLPPAGNLGLCQTGMKTSLEAKGEKIKAKQQHVF